MPTAVRVGPYRIFFYSSDRGEPPHVHVEREGRTAKFWLAHIVNGHLQAKATQNAIVQTVAIIAALATASDCQRNSNCMPPAAAAALGGLATRGAIEATGYNRDMEREADYQGLHYAAAAGYRPEAAGDFLRQMLAVDRGAGRAFTIPFLASHPANAERVGRISKWLMSELPSAGRTLSFAEMGTRVPARKEASNLRLQRTALSRRR